MKVIDLVNGSYRRTKKNSINETKFNFYVKKTVSTKQNLTSMLKKQYQRNKI